MKLHELVLRYALFAAIATVVNLGVQRGVLAFGTGPVLFVIALGAGTMAGLMVKYVLDKKWIFYAASKSVAEDSKRFTLYTAMAWSRPRFFGAWKRRSGWCGTPRNCASWAQCSGG